MTIKRKAQAVLEDVTGALPITLDVNFDEKHKDCVQVTLKGQKSIIKYTDLFAFMFTIATKEQQALMMPVTQELGNEYMKQIRIKCTKNMKKGEELVVNVKIHVPSVVKDSKKLENN